MSSVPSVSVCIPIYQGEAFLEQCLETVRLQDFADFEVLIVDDRSSDGGPGIAQRWAKADPRFRYIENPVNLGLVGNWNRCIELARGEWIKFLFQDDLITPNCLSRLLDAGHGGSGFVASARRLVYGEDIDAETRAWYEMHAAILRDVYRNQTRLSADAYASIKLDHLAYNIVGEPSVTLIRRALFATYGSFDARYSHICDSEMWNRLGTNVGLDWVADELAGFRVHSGAASAVFRSKPFRGAALDPLLELHEMRCSPRFANLRRVAEGSGRRAVLDGALTASLHYAFDLARSLEASGRSDPRIRTDLRDAVGRLVNYRSARVRHAVFRVRRWLAGALRGL